MKLLVPTQVVVDSWTAVGRVATAVWAPVQAHTMDIPSASFFVEGEGIHGENNVYHSQPASSWGTKPETVTAYVPNSGTQVRWLPPYVDLHKFGFNIAVNYVHRWTGIKIYVNRYSPDSRDYFPQIIVTWLSAGYQSGSKYYARKSTWSAQAKGNRSTGYSYAYSYTGIGSAMKVDLRPWLQHGNWTSTDILDNYLSIIQYLTGPANKVVGKNRELGSPTRATLYTVQRTTVPDYSRISRGEMFRFHEPDRFDLWFKDPWNYWYNLMKQESFLAAVEGFPRLNDNMIANVLDVVKFIYNLVFRHKIEMPDNLAQGWLSYRYVYTTTKLDIREAVSYVRRVSNLEPGNALKQYGISYQTIDDVTYIMRCKVVARHRELDILNTIMDKLYEYGLSPSFYTFWDLLPYSFIVDWFIPIGEVAKVWDAELEYSEEHYDYSSITYSLQYMSENDGVSSKQYSRWVESSPPRLAGFYALEARRPSQRTVGYRIIDAASLVLG